MPELENEDYGFDESLFTDEELSGPVEEGAEETEDTETGAEEEAEEVETDEASGEEDTEEAQEETEEETVVEQQEESEIDTETMTISKTEFDDLRKTLDELSAKVLEAPSTSAKPTEAAASVGTSGEEVDFMGELDIDEVATDPALMNRVLNQVLQTAQRNISQAVASSLPSLVQPTIRQTIAMDRSIEKFYETHSLLNNFRSVVGQVANKLQEANPEDSLDALMPKIAEESYKLLKIDPKALKQPQRRSSRSAGLPGTTTPARAPEKEGSELSEQEQQILDLLE